MTGNSQAYRNAQWLDLQPCGVLVLNREGRVKWLNATLEQFLGAPAADLLEQTRDSLPRLRALFDGDEILQVHGTEDDERWLKCAIRNATGPDGAPVRLHFYQDVSTELRLRNEQQRLLQQVEQLTLTDELTGLANRRSLVQTLQAQVTRSRRYHNPLSLGLLCVELRDPRSGLSQPVPDQLLRDISECLRERLRWADVIGRYTPDCFLMLLPETDRQAAEGLIAKVVHDTARIPIPEAAAGSKLLLRHGLAQWQKGYDPNLLLERAFEALEPKREGLAVSQHA
jgi:diguanylate cyclase (GGDEF)-like protein